MSELHAWLNMRAAEAVLLDYVNRANRPYSAQVRISGAAGTRVRE
jgi:hypothetical protein